VTVTRSARGTVPAPGHARETYPVRVADWPDSARASTIVFLAGSLKTSETWTDASCTLRSVGRSGPVGAHPQKGTGHSRTLAGSVRSVEITIHDLSTHRIPPMILSMHCIPRCGRVSRAYT
jgi:hypothetical protein